ncbi:MAG: 2-oxo acid dehydrogenase subunit E2 [Chloroflexi bacterium]|nr:2-oxo acid dehydrogenase subunit E2 [Chloroflexota bacterium]
MPVKVLMPQVAETVVEGTITKWLKKPGERVDKYESLLEIETAKVVTEVPSPAAGVVKSILAQEGQTLPVGAELAVIEEAGAAAAAPPVAAPPAAGRAAERPAAPPPVVAPAAPPAPPAPVEAERGPSRATPAVRRLAEEHDIDISHIQGTGLGGRVTREDVERFIAQREAAVAAAKAPPPPPPPPPPPAAPPAAKVEADEEVVPLTPTRRAIAEHMVRSKRTSPHVWSMMEADITRLVALRESLKEPFQQRYGFNLTYLPFVVKAVVDALREFPYMNSVWGEDKIVLKKRIHIGVAIGREEGLIVPVLRNAQDMGVVEIARGIDELVRKARENRLKIEDVTGGTFTVNNTGAFGSVASLAIINQPQAAILTFEAIVKRPVVVNDAIAIRSMVNVTLSFDHRIVDGSQAGAFLGGVVKRLGAYGPEMKLVL